MITLPPPTPQFWIFCEALPMHPHGPEKKEHTGRFSGKPRPLGCIRPPNIPQNLDPVFQVSPALILNCNYANPPPPPPPSTDTHLQSARMLPSPERANLLHQWQVADAHVDLVSDTLVFGVHGQHHLFGRLVKHLTGRGGGGDEGRERKRGMKEEQEGVKERRASKTCRLALE